MPRKRRTIYSANTCRVCLNNDGLMSDIFVTDIQTKITDFAKSIAINGNYDKELPKKICHICLYKLEMWDNLRAQFIETTQVLLEHLETSELSDSFLLPAKKRVMVKKENSPEINEPVGPFETIFLTPNNDNVNLVPPDKDDKFVKKPVEEEKKVPSPMKTRSAGARKTSEQRRESTRRWAARKKARLAATGSQETESDSETISSDAGMSSPPKSRSKVVKSDRFGKRMKNNHKLSSQEESNAGFNYDEMNETKQNNRKRGIKNLSIKDEPEDDGYSEIKKIKLSKVEGDENNSDLPSLQSELRVGDSVFLITSTLVSNAGENVKKPLNNNIKSNEDPRENTDIIDAVQLKRVSPQKVIKEEIDGSEETLQRVQTELDAIIESNIRKEMLRNSLRDELNIKDERPSVEHQVKLAIENAVKTLESSNSALSSRFPAALAKAALKSRVFQPKVVLNRLNLASIAPKLSKYERNNSFNQNNQASSDINVAMHLELDDSSGIPVLKEQDTKEVKKFNKKAAGKRTEHVEDRKPSILKKSVPPVQKVAKKEYERHPCDKCTLVFQNNNQLEAHKLSMHIEKPPTPVKSKLMRCKRCHEIVEARLVKSHVCKSKIFHRCIICNAAFRTQSLLLQHKATHDEKKDGGKSLELLSNMKNSCFVCDKLFSSVEVLNKHLQEHCDGTVVDDEPKVDDNNHNPKSTTVAATQSVSRKVQSYKYQCLQCFESFPTPVAMDVHLNTHRKDPASSDVEKKNNQSPQQRQLSPKGPVHQMKQQLTPQQAAQRLLLLQQQQQSPTNPQKVQSPQVQKQPVPMVPQKAQPQQQQQPLVPQKVQPQQQQQPLVPQKVQPQQPLVPQTAASQQPPPLQLQIQPQSPAHAIFLLQQQPPPPQKLLVIQQLQQKLQQQQNIKLQQEQQPPAPHTLLLLHQPPPPPSPQVAQPPPPPPPPPPKVQVPPPSVPIPAKAHPQLPPRIQTSFNQKPIRSYKPAKKIEKEKELEDFVVAATCNEIFSQLDQEPPPPPVPEIEEDVNICFLCEKTFSTLDQLQEHVTTH